MVGRAKRVGVLALVAISAVAFGLRAEEPVFTVGVVVDGPWSQNPMIRSLTLSEVGALTEGEFDVRFPPEKFPIGDWTYNTALRNIQQLLDDPEVDLVITWGLISSHAVCCLGDLPKPVIAPVVVDPRLQGLPFEDGTSGIKNLNYVSLPDTLAQELDTFRAIVPFRKVAILTSAQLLEAVPELVERTRQNLDGTGLDFDYIPAGTSAAEVLEAIPSDADAIYAWPLFQFSPEEYRRLIDGLIERKLPSFSGLGGADVEAGMLASAGSPEFFPKLARRIALNVQRILLGEDPGDLPVEFSVREKLVINMATARAIDVSPRWEVLIEAELLHAENVEGAYHLSLEKAVAEAIEVNLDVVARRRFVSAGEQEIEIARSKLKPQLGLSATSVTIDDDRAEASFGNQSERTVTGSTSLTQLLYSEPARANVSIQRSLQDSRRYEYETLRADVALEAATAYLNLMRGRALERVQRNNVDRTRSNLDLANVRRGIGVASAGEVLRWESELASARKSLVESVGDRRTAEIAVNRLLHRRLEDPFIAEEVTLEEPAVLTGGARFLRSVETPKNYLLFRDFLVLEGLARAPELAILDAGVAAQMRVAKSAKRAFWAPTVSLQATFDEIVSRGGAGADGAGGPFALPLPNDTNWTVALNASIPLITGGSRAAEEIQAEITLEQLQLERSSVSEKVEQRIRSALELSRASFLGIALSTEAAEAADANLDLVEDAYARGAAALLDLLDAQTSALNAEEVAANALYDFLIDWLEAQRAAYAVGFFVDPLERQAFFDRWDTYLEAQP